MSFWESIQPPEDISVSGEKIDWLFNYITVINLFFFVLVCAGLFGFSYLYSAKRNPKPFYTYGNLKIHLVVVLVIDILVFLSLDMAIAKKSNDDLLSTFWKFPDPEQEKVLRVQVMAQQWGWNYRLAGEDGIFNTKDDIVTFNDLRVPADTKLLFHLTSKDVIHSFFIPNARIKVDALPGRITRLWTELTKPGEYQIACAEMCGSQHYNMKSQMIVYTPEEFEQWKEHAAQMSIAAHDEDYPDMNWGWEWENN